MAAPKDPPSPVKPRAPNAQQLAMQRLGLRTDWDLVLHLPLRHEDETRIDPLACGRDGQALQFEGAVTHSEVSLSPRRQLRVTVLDAADGRSSCVLRFIHFYPQHQKTLAVGQRVRVRGELRVGLWGREMVHPTFKPASAPLPQGLTPIYPGGAGLSQAYLRKAVAGALQRVLDERHWRDTLPSEILNKFGLQRFIDLRSSLFFLHSPTPDSAAVLQGERDHPAWQRLKVEELLAQQLSQVLARRERSRFLAPVLGSQGSSKTPLHEALLASLPFALTGAQQRVVAEISRDLARSVPMHRLLQGDVGAGKTVVAALAACICMDAGWQCALMAPTEILATQHFAKLVAWLEPLLSPRGLSVAWLTGSQKKKERTAMLARVASGEAGLVVGTHALIQEQVAFARLGLAIIDEQHRFGVAQRLALRGKLGGRGASGTADASAPAAQEPHMLMMTATPIPRTLAMSYYADLDVSTIDELPPGRTPIVTRVVSDERRDEVMARIGAQVAQGRQVYWVCPLIDEQAEGAVVPDDGRLFPAGSAAQGQARPGREAQLLRNVTATHTELCEALPGVAVALLHSRLPTADKQAVMAAFSSGQVAVLVSTTVIEVGVDVPNASLMVIEHAERFGLSQLHQLRGRVGRGAAASACVLLYTAPLSPHGRERLKAMAQTADGFEIARIDLALRGPGEFLGARQSGDALLRFADLDTDADLLAWAQAAAPRLLDERPDLAHLHLQRWLGGKSDYLKA
jgi:ATP-dependent DNA helicase RecG